MLGLEINYLGVLLAAVAGFLIGSAWYSEVSFGKTWMKLAKITKRDTNAVKKKGMWKPLSVGFLNQLITATMLGVVFALLGALGAKLGMLEAMVIGFTLWLGFVATSNLSAVIWEKKPVKLYVLNMSYNLVQLVVMSLIISYF